MKITEIETEISARSAQKMTKEKLEGGDYIYMCVILYIYVCVCVCDFTYMCVCVLDMFINAIKFRFTQ